MLTLPSFNWLRSTWTGAPPHKDLMCSVKPLISFLEITLEATICPILSITTGETIYSDASSAGSCDSLPSDIASIIQSSSTERTWSRKFFEVFSVFSYMTYLGVSLHCTREEPGKGTRGSFLDERCAVVIYPIHG